MSTSGRSVSAFSRLFGVLMLAIAIALVGVPAQASVASQARSADATFVIDLLLPTISGTSTIGSTLTLDPGVWTPADATLTYQWYSDTTAIAGATGLTYSPGLSDFNHKISATVTGAKTGASPSAVLTAQTGPIALLIGGSSSPASTAPPVIDGHAKVGSTLTATTGSWSANGTFMYQWLSDGVVIRGANLATFIPTSTEQGQAISVRVYDTASGLTGNATSAATQDVVAPDITNSTIPVVSGQPAVGSTLTATTGTWTPEPTTFSYQWNADDVGITGATASTFAPTANLVGRQISVTVTAHKSGSADATATSAKTAAVQAVAVPAEKNLTVPTITGVARVGVLLTASQGTWDPTPSTVTYQWFANGAALSSASAPTFVVRPAQVGRTITVRVTATKTGVGTAQATSKATARVAKAKPVYKVFTASRAKHQLVIFLTVSAPGVPVPGGKVGVRLGSRVFPTLTVRNGHAQVTLNNVASGNRKLRLSYLGTSTVAAATNLRTVHVR